MAKTKISEYSSTSAGANLNTDIASINIDEGCSPANINNAIRALMAQVKDLQSGASGDTIPVTAGGTGSATVSDARTALSAAKSGANSDITSITGLTTPLSIAQGGTGYSTTAQIATVGRSGTLVTITTVNTHGFVVGDTVTVAANTNTAVNDSKPIVSVDAGTNSFTYNTGSAGTITPVADTGTAITSSQRYVNLTSNVTGTLPLSKGGLGVTSLTKNTLIVGNGTSAFNSLKPSTNGKVVTSKVGSTVNAADLVEGVEYTILTVGSTLTNWTSIGASLGTVGEVFTKNSTAATGNGTATENTFSMESIPTEVVSGSSTTVNAGSFVTGVYYTILTVGTTDFTLIGASANTVGVTFKATGVGTGTGTATTYRNGYMTLGGFKFQWGFVSNITANSTTSVTFPSAYSVAPLNVQLSMIESSSSDRYTLKIDSYSTTGFSIRETNGTTPDVYWFSIGY